MLDSTETLELANSAETIVPKANSTSAEWTSPSPALLILRHISILPAAADTIIALVFVMLLFNSAIGWLIESDLGYDAKIGKGTVCGLVISIVVIALLIFGALFTPAFYAKELHRIPGVTTEQGVVDMISIDHIRVVPYGTALWKADKKVGELGYKLEVQEPHIQYREGELKWLAPLEYNGLYKW